MKTYILKRTRLGHTSRAIWSVWEPDTTDNKHSVTEEIEGHFWGRVGSNWLPLRLERMPSGIERQEAVRSYFHGLYSLAYSIIRKHCPEVSESKADLFCDIGQMETMLAPGQPDCLVTIQWPERPETFQ